MKKRFVDWEVLNPKLPIFLNKNLSSEQLDRLVDMIEEELILEKAKEIKEKRSKKDET